MTTLVSIPSILYYLVLNTWLVSEKGERLINAISRLYQSEIDELVRDKAKEGRMNESECWCELRHAAGRLLSYLQAVKVLVSTRKRWPALFEDFEVCYVFSSAPDRCPLGSGRKVKELTMGDIIGRMTSDPQASESYRAHAKELEKFEVDKDLQMLAGGKTFRPIVHAEVLILESLQNDGGTHPSRFFGGFRYIGCSKPTCRLCEYYFSFHASGVEVRPAHRNIYPSWRMPDVHSSQGPRARRDREKLMEKILGRVRGDAFRTMIEKVPEKKVHDSNTEPTYPVEIISDDEPEDIDNLTTEFESFDIGYPSYEEKPDFKSRISVDALNLSAADSDAEEGEEGGGAKL